MRARVQRWLTYLAAIAFMGAGLALYSAAEAGASIIPGSCTVAVSSPLPGPGLATSLTTSLACSGMPATDPAFISSGGGLVGFQQSGESYSFGIFETSGACPNSHSLSTGSYTYTSASFTMTGVPDASTSFYSKTVGGVCIGITSLDDRGAGTFLGAANQVYDFVQPLAYLTFSVGSGAFGCSFGSLAGYVSGTVSDGRTSYPFTLYSSTAADQYVFIDTAEPTTTARAIDGHTFYQEQILNQIARPSGAQPFTVTPPSGDPVDFQMWCDVGGTWTNWGNAGSATVYSGTTVAGCTFQEATGYVGDASDGSTIYSFVLTFLGGASKIVALDTSQPASGSTESLAGHTFYVDQVLTVDNAPIAPDAIGVTPTTGDIVNPTFWCDSGGTWTNWGASSSFTGVTPPPGGVISASPDQCSDGGAFCFLTCFSTTGMSLYNPVSWVTGIAKFTICGVRWVLQPSSSKVTALTNQFGLGSNAPAIGSNSASQWLGSGAYLLAAGPYTSMVSIQSAEQAGGCSLLDGSGYAIGTHHFSVCTALASVSSTSSANTAWSVIKPVVAAGFLVMFFLALIAMLRKLLGSNT